MSGLFDKLAVPVFGLAAAVSGGCYAGANSIEEPRTEPMIITEPGTYKVIPGDVFKGPLGVDFRVDEIDEFDQIQGSYVNSRGDAEFKEVYARKDIPVAYYQLKILPADDSTFLTFTNNPKAIYDRCTSLLTEEYDPSICSFVSPTEALDGEVLVESPSGYFGKVNDSQYSQLATCAAMDLESSVQYTSEFLGLSVLSPGATNMYILTETDPPSGGWSLGNLSIWYFKENDVQNIDYEYSSCLEKINTEEFSHGSHEITHIFTNQISHLLTLIFSEGLANFIAHKLNGHSKLWNHIPCLEEGLNIDNGTTKPYCKYKGDSNENITDITLSGECFFVKLTHDHGDQIVKPLIKVLFENKNNKNFTFKDAFWSIGLNPNDYNQWGLGQ